MLQTFLFIGNLFKHFKQNNSKNFWLTISLAVLIFLPFNEKSLVRFSLNQSTIEKNISTVISIKPCGDQIILVPKPKYDKYLSMIGFKRKKYSLAVHRKLEKNFPDWKARIDYQKQQEKFYKTAFSKLRELYNLRVPITPKYFTKDEWNSIEYFNGSGFYKQYQNLKVAPNVFDTRQTFLLKMHDEKMRNNFLNSLNVRKEI